ncbi:hypothetical protein EXIGLDRAFT_114865 [Exidia glandulosa HHB12029]|uniref:Uncharacterized protein n=1 Tax=Exidia glandulosa HHB12029 TaxID=1314781 RepID=A0A166ACI4_EXIGL|nr:hypothetical protein EXIGLDRAFT_114865 [Exidia glandulosa HHB12029]
MSKTPKPVHAAKPAAHPKPPASHPKLVTKKPSKGHFVHGSTSTTLKTKRPVSPKPANPAPSRPLDISIVMEKYFGVSVSVYVDLFSIIRTGRATESIREAEAAEQQGEQRRMGLRPQ